MSLTRKQVRLLTISAGDHERLPDDEDSRQDDIDLTTGKKPDEFEIKGKHIARIRKAVKNQGGEIGYKSHVVDKYIGKKIKPQFKRPSNPVKHRMGHNNPKESGNIKDLISMGLKGQSNIKIGNRLKKKLSKPASSRHRRR
jgi:hypothetical protein